MIVYHGSYIPVEKPDLKHSRSNVDFGTGFYTTPIYEQAVKWCGKFKRRGMNGVANDRVFNTVELYFDGLIDKTEAISRLRYEKPNLQICLRSERTLKDYLYFQGSEQI